MSGAQPKAGNIAGVVALQQRLIHRLEKRFAQGWVDEVYDNLDLLLDRASSGNSFR